MSRPELSSIVYVGFYDVSYLLQESLFLRERKYVLTTEFQVILTMAIPSDRDKYANVMKKTLMIEIIPYFISCDL